MLTSVSCKPLQAHTAGTFGDIWRASSVCGGDFFLFFLITRRDKSIWGLNTTFLILSFYYPPPLSRCFCYFTYRRVQINGFLTRNLKTKKLCVETNAACGDNKVDPPTSCRQWELVTQIFLSSTHTLELC